MVVFKHSQEMVCFKKKKFPYHSLDFIFPKRFIYISAIHTQDQEAHKAGTAACEFKEVKSATLHTILHNFFTNNSQKRENLQTNNMQSWIESPISSANRCL